MFLRCVSLPGYFEDVISLDVTLATYSFLNIVFFGTFTEGTPGNHHPYLSNPNILLGHILINSSHYGVSACNTPVQRRLS